MLTVATMLAALPLFAAASAAIIDDSGTFIRTPVVQMKWQPSKRPRITNTLTGSTEVRVQLNVAPWRRQIGRIYLVLPAQPPGPIRASWSSQGHLLPGQVVSGGRALVYAGRIDATRLEDILQLTLEVGATTLHEPCRLEFRFELET